jgi:ABC-type uncharacterized transport system substrate-binding protein
MARTAHALVLAASGLTGFAGPAAAHPHVFIDTTVTAILDPQGKVTGVRLRWDYDALVSMVVAEDKGADADMDGMISPTEAVVLDGFDMTWIDGFDGDTGLYQNEAKLPLKPGPQDWATGWAAGSDGGHLWSEYTRWLATPVDPGAGPVSIVVYDVSDYTAYTLTAAALSFGDSVAHSTPCRIEPPPETDATDGGLLSTLGLFFFGQDDPVALAEVPPPAKGRVVVVLSCG